MDEAKLIILVFVAVVVTAHFVVDWRARPVILAVLGLVRQDLVAMKAEIDRQGRLWRKFGQLVDARRGDSCSPPSERS